MQRGRVEFKQCFGSSQLFISTLYEVTCYRPKFLHGLFYLPFSSKIHTYYGATRQFVLSTWRKDWRRMSNSHCFAVIQEPRDLGWHFCAEVNDQMEPERYFSLFHQLSRKSDITHSPFDILVRTLWGFGRLQFSPFCRIPRLYQFYHSSQAIHQETRNQYPSMFHRSAYIRKVMGGDPSYPTLYQPLHCTLHLPYRIVYQSYCHRQMNI